MDNLATYNIGDIIINIDKTHYKAILATIVGISNDGCYIFWKEINCSGGYSLNSISGGTPILIFEKYWRLFQNGLDKLEEIL